MNQLDEQKKVEALRQRLYSRGEKFDDIERRDIGDVAVDVSRNWNLPQPKTEDVADYRHSRRYRWFVLIGSFLFLLLTAVATGFYMFSGGNQISSANIGFNIEAPTTLGGGERFDAQIGVTNQNAVAIESVTLIVTYPEDSQTVSEPTENLYEERIWIDRLEPGESKNISLSAVVYGEEGEERQLRAQLEYRIVDSDSMFYKDAEPHTFRITSSPVTLQVQSVRQVSAGQEVEVELKVTSNTNSEYNNLLVTANYPRGFAYKNAEPSPSYNQNVWRIESLKPEETKTIKVRGTVTGLANEALRLSVSVGPSDPGNQFIAGSSLTNSYTEFIIERPFINVLMSINDQRQSPVVLQSQESAKVDIEVTNTLDESVYDMVVEVVPSGSAISGARITSGSGFYDSNRNVVRFEPSTVSGFSQFLAGETESLDLTIEPQTNASTATFSVTVNVYGRRVNNPGAQEQLFGTTKIEARYASTISLGSAVRHTSGPLPPVVGQDTQYQVTLTARAGSNEITGGVLRTTLPQYVTWQNSYQADGAVEYNPVTRELTWQVEDISGGQSKDLRFAVSLLPSSSQVGTKPVLVGGQTFTAKDRFTNTELQTSQQSISTEIGSVGNFDEGSGTVQASQ